MRPVVVMLALLALVAVPVACLLVIVASRLPVLAH